MKKVQLKPLQHRGQECIGLYFDNSAVINGALRQKAGARWSQTNKCWYVPLSEENHNRIYTVLQGKAVLDEKALLDYLSEKKTGAVLATTGAGDAGLKTVEEVKSVRTIQKAEPVADNVIHPANAGVLPELKQQLVLRGYSASTIRTYMNEMRVFLVTVKEHPVKEFTPERLRDYFQFCLEALKLTENTLHSRINALKFYYERVLKREKFFFDIPRPKKGMQLPRVLSKEEMVRLLRAIENVKHKTMIMLGYACGLRVSEIIHIELRDVDKDRHLLMIRRGKGKKDRVVSLSPVMMVMLQEYQAIYATSRYLFEGQESGEMYSIRSLQAIIQKAKEKAGINREGGMHMLRHSFATHLIEKGTDVVFIQRLLGHNDIKTTLRYLHVTNKNLLNIISPLDDIKDFL